MLSQAQTPIVADSSVLLGFAAIGQTDLLKIVAAEVWVPPGVVAEVTAKDYPPNRILRDALTSGTILKSVDLPASAAGLVSRYGAMLGRGESEAIALAHLRKLTVLLDDLAARRLATSEGVAFVGSLGVLVACKNAGVIPRVRPLVEALVEAGRFFGPVLLRDFYRSQNEA